ncbi:MAG: threonine--tRNA ligase [Candidatus Saccharimonadales bacterium]|jgi:threonyl-tRNA synthetase
MEETDKLKENDHRRLGQELDLFVFSDLVGAGLPLWTPRGTILREELDRFVQGMRDEYGFQAVTIPHITKKELYQKSGHWTKFSNDLFHIKSREGHEFAMKPMNCPHHMQIYASRPRSYRELPIRYRETTMNYRDEQTGELNGLLRARSFTQDDAHVFCREEHILDEVLKIWGIIENFYKTLGFDLSLRFSRRDPSTPDAYAGSSEKWQRAEGELKKALDNHPHAAIEDGLGDAAFYGPKLDFIAKDSLGRDWQVATIQIDFAQPEGLDLTYVNEKGENERPVMIHCAIMGSIERFLAVYIEHTSGKFPIWLAPEQLRVATLNDEKNILKMAQSVVEKAKTMGVRVMLDDSNESVAKKIRDAEVMKVPYVVVIGNKELENGKVAPRHRSDLPELPESSVGELLQRLSEDAKARK